MLNMVKVDEKMDKVLGALGRQGKILNTKREKKRHSKHNIVKTRKKILKKPLSWLSH